MKSLVLIVLMLMLTSSALAVAPGQKLILLYSNDVHGETEPCG